ILAKYYSVPFYVAAPISTFDKDSKSGSEIIIENRNQEEVFKINQIKITKSKKALNPAFDITPSKLISGIITDKGIINKPYKNKIKKLFST
ncbi:MAG: S-methyl-5-thioribose-1-phosphate isomerase, partial [Thermodesulfobacteriota bacterium]|nr:S-methyl-5-thioribose-1-phosphate isomerase [Thermodesulfobacteriota bacterium]